MVVELIGGPLDGAVINGPSHMPVYMIVSGHQEGPVYRLGCCGRCGMKRKTVPYLFLGYEEMIRHEYPEKSQDIKAIEQQNTSIQDPEARA